MTNEYKAKCPLCDFFLIDDTNPEKIIKMISNHAEIAHKRKIVFKDMVKTSW